MAVAKAQGQGGFTAIHIWLIVFVALWLASTVMLVLLYLDQDKLVSDTEEMRQQVAKVIGNEGRKLPQFSKAKAANGQTCVDLLEVARSEAADVAIGDPTADTARLLEMQKSQLERIRSDAFIEEPSAFEGVSFHDALSNMYEVFRREATARLEAEDRVASFETEMAQLRDKVAVLTTSFDEDATEWKAQLASVDRDKTNSLKDHESQIGAFEEQIERIKQQCSDDIQSQRSENSRIRKDYEDLMARFQQLKEKLGQSQVAPLPLATARAVDGQILTAAPGDEVVYIDLGSRNHLTLGLEFSVYDALEGVPEDGRAKARVEVVSIDEKTAVCRIEEMLGHEMIVRGDLIANPVYDRYRTLRFYVLGEFDLNGDGRDDKDGVERIEALIKQWGGAIESGPSAQVDFVVLGGAPSKPSKGSVYDVEEDDSYLESQRAYEAYATQLQTIDALAIPRLTQSVFLSFLGYRGTLPLDFQAASSLP